MDWASRWLAVALALTHYVSTTRGSLALKSWKSSEVGMLKTIAFSLLVYNLPKLISFCCWTLVITFWERQVVVIWSLLWTKFAKTILEHIRSAEDKSHQAKMDFCFGDNAVLCCTVQILCN